ncbi:uncharacterized protein LOC135497603 [Lineus longissimus]|uniref:uncharacterized protein LOC135497603 n=1 Tax=Lineus longissimus TaxID=88925 RepID=UPI002B4DFB7A
MQPVRTSLRIRMKKMKINAYCPFLGLGAIMLIASLTVVKGEVHEKTVCTNTYMSIDCGDLRIHILDAVSGKSRQRSPPCHMTPGDETFNNSFAVSHLWKQCNMRPNCHVFLNDGHYYTYVFIKYQCIKEIPAFDICSSLTSSPLIKGHLFSPGYPLMIPRQHPTKCTCRIALHSLINLRMDIMTDELRCPEKQRINVFSRNKTLESSYTCQTFNKSPLYIYNGSDIVFEFINKYYAAGGKFWIQFSADKHITVACGSSSSTPIAMSKLANVLRVPMTDDTQSMTTISPKTESRDQEPQVIPEFHIYHGDPKRQAPQFGLVFNILIVSTVLLAFTITLYICWQHHTRKNKGPSHSRQELPTKVI